MITVDHSPIPMRDGVVVTADVAAPSDGPTPTLLFRTPYGRAGSRMTCDLVGLVEQGWSVVVSDVRGRGGSGGRFDPFHQETNDGVDTIDWIAEQPWCDGRVAMAGGSYRGAVQWSAAAAGHPALGAIAPLMTTARFGEGWSSENGIALAGFLRVWALRFAMSAPDVDAAVVERARELVDRLLAAPSTHDIDREIGELFPTFERWMRPDDEAYFGPLDLLAGGRIRTAARQTGGWYDMFCEGGLKAFATLSSSLDPAQSPQRMLVGPWSHIGAASAVVGDRHFGPGADPERLRLVEREIEWLGAALSPGRRSELGHRLSVYVLGRGDWIDLPAWPPREAVLERWQLGADGVVLAPGESPAEPGECVVEHDPNRPLPTHGGRGFGFWPRSGPLVGSPGRDAETDPRLIRYVSAPVERSVTVIGRIVVELQLAPVVTDCHAIVRVEGLAADGSSMLIVEQGTQLKAGARATDVRLDAGSTAWYIRPGERIAVSVSMSSWPRLAVAPKPGSLVVRHGDPNRCAILLPTTEVGR